MNYLTQKFQWLAVLLTIASLFLSACGSDEEDDLEELERNWRCHNSSSTSVRL